MKYAIYEGNLDRLEKKLKRIFNKCKAYGCDFHYEQTGEEFRELKDEKGNKYTARFANRRDLVDALLDEDKSYTMKTVDNLVEKYMKGQVK